MCTKTLAAFLVSLAAAACSSPSTGDDSTTASSTSAATTTSTEPTGTGPDVSVSGTSTGPGTDPTTPTTTDATTSTTVEPTTTTLTTDATTGGMVVFPTDCDDPISAPFADAMVDTFFVNEAPVGAGCTLGGEGELPCRDREFGAAAQYQLFHDQQGDPQEPFISLFAARFAAPEPTYTGLAPEFAAYEGLPVPQTSWVGAQVKLHVSRPAQPAPWQPVDLQMLRFAPGDVWESGDGQEFTACVDPAASFRCRKCAKDDLPCTFPWAQQLPFTVPVEAVAERSLVDEPGGDGLDIVFDLPPVTAMNAWLITEGMMVVPAPTVGAGVLAVHTLEAQPELRPQLSVRYCNPVLQ